MAAAREGFEIWRHTPPQERARLLRQAAQIIREHAERLAYVDAADGGNPISKVRSDVEIAAKRFEFPQGITFANGLVILASGQKGKAASGSPAASLVVQLIYK